MGKWSNGKPVNQVVLYMLHDFLNPNIFNMDAKILLLIKIINNY